MSEDEAKAKWCPFARTIFASRAEDNSITVRAPQVAFNIYTMDEVGDRAIPGGATCNGSACMAWRWEGATLTKTPSDKGYCGLAGRP